MKSSNILKIVLLVLAVVVLALIGQLLLAIAINAVTLIAYILLAVLLVYLLPVFIYGLRVGGKRTKTAITVADPLNALKVEYDDLCSYIDKQADTISKADGDLAHLKSIVKSSQGVLAVDRIKEWEATIESQTKGIDFAKLTLATLVNERKELKTEIEGAKLELSMIDANNAISNTISGKGTREISEQRQDALNAIAKRTAQSKAKLSNAITQLETNRAT